MKRKPFYLFVLFLVLGCVTTPETGRRAFILTSESEENQMGAQAYHEVLRKERVSHDSRANAILRRVGERIARATGKSDYQWQFTLVESKEQNAFCLPGGKVVVYTGILPVCENEAALATVLGHEVAHATARHGGQRITEALGAELGMVALGAVLGGGESERKRLLLAALGVGANIGVLLPFSRAHEAEADEIGLRYMARAGYDPREAVAFWERFAHITAGRGGPAFLSDHPSSESRVRALRAELPRVLPFYESSAQYGRGESF